MEGSFRFAALEWLTDRLSLLQSSLVEFYPRFETTMRETLRALVGSEVERRVDIGLAKDGSGAGGKLVRSNCGCHSDDRSPKPHCVRWLRTSRRWPRYRAHTITTV